MEEKLFIVAFSDGHDTYKDDTLLSLFTDKIAKKKVEQFIYGAAIGQYVVVDYEGIDTVCIVRVDTSPYTIKKYTVVRQCITEQEKLMFKDYYLKGYLKGSSYDGYVFTECIDIAPLYSLKAAVDLLSDIYANSEHIEDGEVKYLFSVEKVGE